MYFTTQQVSYHVQSFYYCYFSNVNDHFVSHPFTDYLPISIRIVIVLADWHTIASIWQDFDDLSATVTFLLENSSGSVFITTYHNRRYLRIISPPVSPGSVASNISDKSVGFVYAVVIIWLSFWWSSGAWTLKCLKLLDGFSFLPPCKAASLQGNIKFVETALEVWRGKT